MSMLKSLNSGVSGMGANQTKLDVIGNNIANVGTTAFKGSRVRFEDALNQTITDASVPTQNQGGTNAEQVGLGVKVAGIDTIMTGGPIQTTGRNLDAAISGEGYFVVGSGPTVFTDNTINVNQSAGQHSVDQGSLAQNGMNLSYTRDGSFTLDNQGNLLTSDGLRIMGYSLTNDNSTTPPTSAEPSSVIAGGFNFQFAPGEALNGYTVVLGKIGAGTLTTASVDTTNKKIVLNGDFSDAGKISSASAQTAINGALSGAGIAQTVSVSGTESPIYGTASDAVANGANADSPNNTTVGGLLLTFNQGSQLNGYTVKLGNVAANTATSASIDTNSKVITLNGDFTTVNAVNSSQVQTALQNAIQIAQTDTPPLAQGASIAVSGSPINISASGLASNGNISYRGMSFNFTDSNGNPQLNGYKIQLGTITAGTTTSASIDATDKTITVNGDVNSMTAFDFQKAIQNAHLSSATTATLDSNGSATFGGFNINLGNTYSGYTIQLASPLATTTTTPSASLTGNVITINGDAASLDSLDATIGTPSLKSILDTATGATTAAVTGTQITHINQMDTATTTTVDSSGKGKFGGFDLSFTDTTSPIPVNYSGYTIKLGTTSTGTPVNAAFDTTNKIITIDGNAAVLNSYTNTNLQALINGSASRPVNTSVAVTYSNISLNALGTPTSLSNIASGLIDGGTDAKNPATVTSSGFNFAFGPGAALNGYKINIGTISQGTQLSTDVDTTNHTITINGDFITAGAIGAGQLTAVLNNALNQKGINQTVTATGNPLSITGSTSNPVIGGTPLQSISTNGVIDFVDGSKNVYSYDGSLKSLRIPSTVHDVATGEDLKVKTFSIGSDGVITATLDGGRVAAIGQIAMAQFKNPAGLTKEGNNVYSASITSGDASFKSGVGTKGEDNSALYGAIQQSALEGSNVDLAQQFTDMIEASRAFQANGKTITTGDQVLQDIINLVR